MSSSQSRYDGIGKGYCDFRHPAPRIKEMIHVEVAGQMDRQIQDFGSQLLVTAVQNEGAS